MSILPEKLEGEEEAEDTSKEHLVAETPEKEPEPEDKVTITFLSNAFVYLYSHDNKRCLLCIVVLLLGLNRQIHFLT